MVTVSIQPKLQFFPLFEKYFYDREINILTFYAAMQTKNKILFLFLYCFLLFCCCCCCNCCCFFFFCLFAFLKNVLSHFIAPRSLNFLSKSSERTILKLCYRMWSPKKQFYFEKYAISSTFLRIARALSNI